MAGSDAKEAASGAWEKTKEKADVAAETVKEKVRDYNPFLSFAHGCRPFALVMKQHIWHRSEWRRRRKLLLPARKKHRKHGQMSRSMSRVRHKKQPLLAKLHASRLRWIRLMPN